MSLLSDYKKPIHVFDKNFEKLRADCAHCFGFCCVALYFAASEGFPVDKEAGRPCPNLGSDFKCVVHDNLDQKGFKGCLAYDCLGAGPKTAQITFSGVAWNEKSQNEKEMFAVYHVLQQLHEMLWYLTEALTLKPAQSLYPQLRILREETEQYSLEQPQVLLSFDIEAQRNKVKELLHEASKLVRAQCKSVERLGQKQKKTLGRGGDFIGADLRKLDLKGADLRGSYFIAADLRGCDFWGADLIGADLRDANLADGDLSECLFLTQRQINAAKGNSKTKLPLHLLTPVSWR